MPGTEGLSRRGFLAAVAGSAVALGAAAPARGATDHKGDRVTARQAMRWLETGNNRWVRGDIQRVDHTPPLRDIAKGQWPFASILSCADSRVNPENVFDVRQGNLFNVRNAGNVGGDISIGSLEYSVAVLGAPLLAVLGHSGCGAVAAAQQYLRTGELPGGDIDAVVEAIVPGIESLPEDHTLGQAIEANAEHSARILRRQSGVIREAVDSGRLRIVHGVYDLRSRRVTWS
jgi:carbonic anhydrase